MSVRTHAERLELAIRERRVVWTRVGSQPRRVRLLLPADKRIVKRWGASSRPLTGAEYKVLHLMPVRFMRRRDDAPGRSGGIVLMAE